MVDHRTMPPQVKQNPIYPTLWKRFHFWNDSFFGIFTGETGSGKSWAAIRMARDLDVQKNNECRFKVKERVFFSAKKFAEFVREKHPTGSFGIWDEAGVQLNAQQWYTAKSQFISFITQTMRFKNYGILFTVPHFTYLSLQTRMLIHAQVEMQKNINRQTNKSLGRWKWMQVGGYRERLRIYRKLPRYWSNGKKYILRKVWFSAPPEHVIEEYEEYKTKVLDGWYKTYEKEMAYMEKQIGKEKHERVDLRELAQTIRENITDYLNEKLRVSYGAISLKHTISREEAITIAQGLNLEIQKGKLKVAGGNVA